MNYSLPSWTGSIHRLKHHYRLMLDSGSSVQSHQAQSSSGLHQQGGDRTSRSLVLIGAYCGSIRGIEQSFPK